MQWYARTIEVAYVVNEALAGEEGQPNHDKGSSSSFATLRISFQVVPWKIVWINSKYGQNFGRIVRENN